jgi:hypothetical protein
MARLTPAQERRLLRKHLTGDFGPGDWRSIEALIDAGMIQIDGKWLLVTRKGREYCDKHHAEMPF